VFLEEGAPWRINKVAYKEKFCFRKDIVYVEQSSNSTLCTVVLQAFTFLMGKTKNHRRCAATTTKSLKQKSVTVYRSYIRYIF